MKNPIWQETYKITSYLVNLRGRAGLYALLNLIQDVGWMHAIHLRVKLPENLTWVFTRQKLSMSEWPAWNESVEIRTWLRPPEGEAFFLRDYEILRNGRQIGECTSTFTVMDMRTRRMAAAQDWSGYADIWRTDGGLIHRPEKIPFREQAETLAQFEVRNSDIDMNRHVNNTKYAQWVLDSISIDTLRGGLELLAYEVNFLAETKSGDQVRVQRASEEAGPDGLTRIQFQGVRVADNKPVFCALMTVKETAAAPEKNPEAQS